MKKLQPLLVATTITLFSLAVGAESELNSRLNLLAADTPTTEQKAADSKANGTTTTQPTPKTEDANKPANDQSDSAKSTKKDEKAKSDTKGDEMKQTSINDLNGVIVALSDNAKEIGKDVKAEEKKIEKTGDKAEKKVKDEMKDPLNTKKAHQKDKVTPGNPKTVD